MHSYREAFEDVEAGGFSHSAAYGSGGGENSPQTPRFPLSPQTPYFNMCRFTLSKKREKKKLKQHFFVVRSNLLDEKQKRCVEKRVRLFRSTRLVVKESGGKSSSVADRLQPLLAVTCLPRLLAIYPQRPTHPLGMWTLGVAVYSPVAQRLPIRPQPVSRQEAQADPERLAAVLPCLRPNQLCLCSRGDRSQISVVLPAVIQRLLPAVPL